MARISKKLKEDFIKEAEKILFSEIEEIKSVAEMNKFLGLILTDEEKELIFKRIVIKKLLVHGKKYREIKKLLVVSSNTISNVKDIIEKRGYGRNPNRKRVYSQDKKRGREKRSTIFSKYKGAQSII